MPNQVMTLTMRRSNILLSSKAALWSVVFWVSCLAGVGVSSAQSGSFIIPTFRGSGSDFAYWDLFSRPPGSSSNTNYQYDNPPALDGGVDDNGNETNMLEDHDENPATDPIPRATLVQNGAEDAFITSSGAIYSFSEVVKFEVPYRPAADDPGQVTNVIFQTQTGGSRLNVNSVKLVYEVAGVPMEMDPIFRGMDDPQSGEFSERIVCAFQWDLSGVNVRNFKIIFESPASSMPLWQAQLDVLTGPDFEQELGYLLHTNARPITRFGRPGKVDKNLPFTADGRFFLEGEALEIIGDPATGWEMTGWFYDTEITAGLTLPLVFPAQDITVFPLFAPLSYAVWREHLFHHANALLGLEDDYEIDTISAPGVDHDLDGLTNAGEYAFGGDPYIQDNLRTQPQLVLVEVEGVSYPAIRYRTNGLEAGEGDVEQTVRVAANGGAWEADLTKLHDNQLQSDGTRLVTERTLLPMSSYASLEMDVAWSVGGDVGTPLAPAALAITSGSTLAVGLVGQSYEVELTAAGGTAPYQWEVASGEVPTGITLGEDGVFSGIPMTAGEYTFTARVTDAFLQKETRSFTVSVAPYVIVTDVTIPASRVDVAVDLQLTLSGGTGPYVWSHVEGDLPLGVSLTAAGALTGAPTVAGSYEFKIEVADDNSLTAEKTFYWTVSDLEIATPATLPGAILNVSYHTILSSSGGTIPYTWTVTGGALPAGLTLADDGVLSGTPAASGNFSFTAQVVDDDGFIASRVFSLAVAAMAPIPVIEPVEFTPITVGAAFTHTITAANHPTKFIVTGLPKGMKAVFSNGTSVISGRSSVSGTYQVAIQASNASGTSGRVTAQMVILGIPETRLGSFTGLAARDPSANAGLGSLLNLTTTSKGAFTLKVKSGSTTKSAKGFLNASAPHVQVNVNGSDLALTLNADTGIVTGTYGSAEVNGWRMVWNKKSNLATTREGFYTVALDLKDEADIGSAVIPQGFGYASFTVLPAGTLKVLGRTADGQAITAATTLGPNGEIAVYASLYARKGTLLGQWEVDEGVPNQPLDNEVTGSLTWQKPLTKGRIYPDAFGPVNLTVEGSYMGTVTKRPVMLGLPEIGALDVSFVSGGVEASATVPDVTGAVWTDKFKADFVGTTNPAKVTVNINKAKGTVTGSFMLMETTPPLTRKGVKILGQVVRLSDGEIKVAGYFLLPQIPASGQKPTATPILSGAFFISQPVVAP